MEKASPMVLFVYEGHMEAQHLEIWRKHNQTQKRFKLHKVEQVHTLRYDWETLVPPNLHF